MAIRRDRVNFLVLVVNIVNSNPIPVRIEQNITQFCFAKSNIKIEFLIVDRGRKARSNFLQNVFKQKNSQPCLAFTSNPHSLWYGVVQDMKHSEPCLSFPSNPHSLWYGVVQDMKLGEPCLSFTSNPHSLWYGVVQDMKHGEPCLSFPSNPHSLWCGVV